jgi:hypothetical protein
MIVYTTITLHLSSNGSMPSINISFNVYASYIHMFFRLSTRKHHHHRHSFYHISHLSSSSLLSILIDTKPKEIDLKKLPDAIDEAVYVHEKFAIGIYMYSKLIPVHTFRSNPLWVVYIFRSNPLWVVYTFCKNPFRFCCEYSVINHL